MALRKIAIIGNSGAGKSTVLKKLSRPLEVAEMGRVERFNKESPPFSHMDVLNWILKETPPDQDVLVVSTSIERLTEMREDKRYNRHPDIFGQILFVYLYNPYPSGRRRFLNMPRAQDDKRNATDIEIMLDNHEYVDCACRNLADVTINTGDLGLDGAASIIRALRDALPLQRAPSP